MNILVTLDSNYLKPLRVMLKSLFLNNSGRKFSIYLMYSNIKDYELDELENFINKHDSILHRIFVDEHVFDDAPVLSYYTKEMYYRLLAFKFLPEDIDRILYLDPDVLIINPIDSLYNVDIDDYLYAASYHTFIKVDRINKIRLGTYNIEAYFNTGVLLMNLERLRKEIRESDIYDFVAKNKVKLIMPDQDVFNALYSQRIKSIDEKLYNYDARYYLYYKTVTNGLYDMEYVINNTVVLHFCGRKKPWTKTYKGKFYSLYKHYEKLAFKS